MKDIYKEKLESDSARNTCHCTLTSKAKYMLPRNGKRRNSKPTLEEGVHNKNIIRRKIPKQQYAITSTYFLRCSQISPFKLAIHTIFKFQKIRTTLCCAIFNVKTKFRTCTTCAHFNKNGACNSSSPRFANISCRVNQTVKREPK